MFHDCSEMYLKSINEGNHASTTLRKLAIFAKILRECHRQNREGLSNFREDLILHTELLKKRLLELSPPSGTMQLLALSDHINAKQP